MKISSCAEYDLNCYILSEEVLGYLGWAGFMVGVLGFAIALYQLSKIRSNSEAVKTAFGKLSDHVDSVNLAYLSGQVTAIIPIIQANNFALAEYAFTPIKRSLRLHAKSIDLEATEDEAMNRTVARIDKQIQWGVSGHQSFDSSKAKRYVDELLSILTEWEGRSANKSKKGIVDEDD